MKDDKNPAKQISRKAFLSTIAVALAGLTAGTGTVSAADRITSEPATTPFSTGQSGSSDGKVRLVLQKVESARPFGIFLRIPGWVNGPVRIAVNGQAVSGVPSRSVYHSLQRSWKSGDVVELELPMPVRYMAAHPAVADACGKIAVTCGPIVYCIEGDDVPADIALERIRVSAGAELKPAVTKELGGMTKLTGTLICNTSETATGDKLIRDEAETDLYREARFAEGAPILSPADRRVSVSMIPYYARLNRKSDFFRIWLPVY